LPGLGERFETEVQAALLRIGELPESATIYAGDSGDCWCEGFSIEFSTEFTVLAS